jgi:transposase
MSDLFWLTEAQMARPKPFFPLSHGVPRVDDRRVLSGIIFINRNGLRRRDAPAAYGPPKTLCNRWARWSRLSGKFIRPSAARLAVGTEHQNRRVCFAFCATVCNQKAVLGK